MAEYAFIGSQRMIGRFLMTIDAATDDIIVIDQENIRPTRREFVVACTTFIDNRNMVCRLTAGSRTVMAIDATAGDA